MNDNEQDHLMQIIKSLVNTEQLLIDNLLSRKPNVYYWRLEKLHEKTFTEMPPVRTLVLVLVNRKDTPKITTGYYNGKHWICEPDKDTIETVLGWSYLLPIPKEFK